MHVTRVTHFPAVPLKPAQCCLSTVPEKGNEKCFQEETGKMMAKVVSAR